MRTVLACLAATLLAGAAQAKKPRCDVPVPLTAVERERAAETFIRFMDELIRQAGGALGEPGPAAEILKDPHRLGETLTDSACLLPDGEPVLGDVSRYMLEFRGAMVTAVLAPTVKDAERELRLSEDEPPVVAFERVRAWASPGRVRAVYAPRRGPEAEALPGLIPVLSVSLTPYGKRPSAPSPTIKLDHVALLAILQNGDGTTGPKLDAKSPADPEQLPSPRLVVRSDVQPRFSEPARASCGEKGCRALRDSERVECRKKTLRVEALVAGAVRGAALPTSESDAAAPLQCRETSDGCAPVQWTDARTLVRGNTYNPGVALLLRFDESTVLPQPPAEEERVRVRLQTPREVAWLDARGETGVLTLAVGAAPDARRKPSTLVAPGQVYLRLYGPVDALEKAYERLDRSALAALLTD